MVLLIVITLSLWSLIYACVSNIQPQNMSLGLHNVMRTISPHKTFLFRLSYLCPLPQAVGIFTTDKQLLVDFVIQQRVQTDSIDKIVFSCTVMGQLPTHVDSQKLLLSRIMYIYVFRVNVCDLAFTPCNS